MGRSAPEAGGSASEEGGSVSPEGGSASEGGREHKQILIFNSIFDNCSFM